MRKLFLILLSCALLWAMASSAQAAGLDAEFAKAVSDFFKADPATVTEVDDTVLAAEDVPVVFFVAQKSGADPLTIARMRASGDSWLAVVHSQKMGPEIFHVKIRGFCESPIYQPIFDKFVGSDQAQWRLARLSDNDVVNLVNLKFLSAQHDYSIYRVMMLRDKGNSFALVNQGVLEAKAQLAQKKAEEKKAVSAGM